MSFNAILLHDLDMFIFLKITICSKHGQRLEMIFKNRHIGLAKAVSSQNVSNDFNTAGSDYIHIYTQSYIY